MRLWPQRPVEANFFSSSYRTANQRRWLRPDDAAVGIPIALDVDASQILYGPIARHSAHNPWRWLWVVRVRVGLVSLFPAALVSVHI